MLRRALSLPALLFVLLANLPSDVAHAQDIQVSATVNAKRVGLDDNLQLTISIKGDTMGRSKTPQLPKLDGFRVAGTPSSSTSIQFINGQMSSVRAFIYTLRPRAEGHYVIDPVTVEYGGKEYRTESIDVEVVSGSVMPRASRRSPGGFADPFDMISPFGGREESGGSGRGFRNGQPI